MKIGCLHDPDTTTSYYPFFLCLSALPSAATSRTLVIIQHAAAAGVQTFQKKENMCKFLDANLIRVAPKCWDTGGLSYLYHGTFGRRAYLQKR
jgi:hypothetical protein